MKTTKTAHTLIESLIVVLTLSALFAILGSYITASIAKIDEEITELSELQEEVYQKIEDGEKIGDLETDEYYQNIEDALDEQNKLLEDLKNELNKQEDN